ncbi:MAG: hypothetical protein JWM44_4465 [Bacilli bacterium]|nr:hypothetical protein [Bacilli bacterium]
MKVISIVLAILLSSLLLILIPVSSVVFSANASILKPYHSQSYFVESGIYPELKQKLKLSILGYKNQEEENKASLLDSIRNKIFNKAFDSVVTDDFVALKMFTLQNSFWDYMTDKSNHIAAIPIPELSAALTKLIDQQILPTLVKQQMKEQLKKNLADSIDIIQLMDIQTKKLENTKEKYLLFKREAWLVYFLMFIVLALSVLLSYLRKYRIKWIGVCMTVGGMITMLIWIPKVRYLQNIPISDDMQDLSRGINQLAAAASNDFMLQLSIAAAIAILIGLAVIWLSPRNADSSQK